jgi:hypothetical protein
MRIFRLQHFGIRQASPRPQTASVQSLRLVLAIAGRLEWILPLWIAITAVILSVVGVAIGISLTGCDAPYS